MNSDIRLSCRGSNDDLQEFLAGTVFDGKTFEAISLGPVNVPEQRMLIHDVVFRNCEIKSGEFVIRSGVEVERVVFDGVESQDSLVISTHAYISEITLKGAPKHGGLWVRPDEMFNPSEYQRLSEWVQNKIHESKSSFMLDITDYRSSNIEILGLPPDKIRYNPDFHVLIEAAWRDTVDWTGLGVSLRGFWGMCLLRIRDFGVDCGVFDLPGPDDRQHRQVLDEAATLRGAGVIRV